MSNNATNVSRTGGFTTRQVAESLQMSADAVRHYVRRRLVFPERDGRGHFRFSFQDVVLLRTAKRLIADQVPTRKANRLLLDLHRHLPSSRSLASLKLVAAGDAVLACERDQIWDVESGQGVLNFQPTQPVTTNVSALPQPGLMVVTETDAMDTDAWYNLGLDLEEVEPERAPEAYRKALELDPGNADAHVNLGRLYQLAGDLRGAKRHYQRALEIAGVHALAAYNLGTVFDELDELDRAAEYYLLAAEVPDAHYNLARIRELQGDELASRRHMRRYRNLLDQS
ncbi:MAG: tetratricopeptide repeat protein [Pseudomonadota bacterium]